MNLRRKYTGAKHDTEAMDKLRFMVGERSMNGEGVPRGALEIMEVRMPV